MIAKSATARAALLSLAAAACGGKSKPAPPPPFEDDLAERGGGYADPKIAPAHVDAPAAKTLIAGHKNARYEFAVPDGLARLRGVTVQDGEDPRELSISGPDGVGIPAPGKVALDGIVVFSDSLGLGVDLTATTQEARGAIIAKYAEYMEERAPSASPPQYVKVGSHMAIRFDLPRVEMPDRPVRAGRHYLVLDGIVTVSVDCLWTEANAAQMAKACDEVAASLRPHRRR